MVSPSHKRRAIQSIVEKNIGTTAQACRTLDLARSSFYLTSQRRPESQAMHSEIAKVHPAISETFTYMSYGDVDLERLEAERRTEAKRKAASQGS